MSPESQPLLRYSPTSAQAEAGVTGLLLPQGLAVLRSSAGVVRQLNLASTASVKLALVEAASLTIFGWIL